MRRFRAFLFVLLAIAVPLQGYAHFAQPVEPCCPMEQMAGIDSADTVAMHDCCDDANTAAKTCKSGQPCQSSGQHFPVSMLDVLPQQVSTPATRFPRVAEILFSFEPAATWRPPAAF